MNYEALAFILLFVCLFVILLEFLWLSVIADKQETHRKKYDEATEKIDAMLQTVLFHPTEEALRNEVEALKKFVGSDILKVDILSNKILNLLVSDKTDDTQKTSLCMVNDAVRPLDIYVRLLHRGNTYEKAYACRKVAVFGKEDELPIIRKLAQSRNPDLAYNAVMALAAFGDEETLTARLLHCENERHCAYSHRVILEVMANYRGDLRSLSRKLLENGGDYMKATVIKGLSDHAFSDFADVYLEGLGSKNANLKCACVRALGRIARPEYEHPLITAAHDKSWIVRSAAAKELVRFPSDRTKQALVEATRDPEWWVRYNAAKALVKIDPDLTYVEQVLSGYDKYGADAVKFVLYKTYDLQEPEMADRKA